jgi:hypothetical protein
MSDEGFILRFFWGPRTETSGQCADRLYEFLAGLATLDPVFSTKWYAIGKDQNNPRHRPIILNQADLQACCERGTFWTEVAPLRRIEGLGFSVDIFTAGYWMLPLSVHCGCCSEYIDNSVVMHLPNSGVAGRRMHRAGFLTRLSQLLVKCWEPDVGQVWSTKLRDALALPADAVEVGWITYVANRVRQPPRFPKEILVVPVEGLGHLFVATRQRFFTENESHLNRARLVAGALNQEGLDPAGISPAARSSIHNAISTAPRPRTRPARGSRKSTTREAFAADRPRSRPPSGGG